MKEVRLIHTSKGNLPIDSLEYTFGWDFDKSGVTYWEKYALDGEFVKESAARFHLPDGMVMKLEQGAING